MTAEPEPKLTLASLAGKARVAAALSAVEMRFAEPDIAALLDEAFARPRGIAIGITGPPGAGKSTLINALIAHWRKEGERVAVLRPILIHRLRMYDWTGAREKPAQTSLNLCGRCPVLRGDGGRFAIRIVGFEQRAHEQECCDARDQIASSGFRAWPKISCLKEYRGLHRWVG